MIENMQEDYETPPDLRQISDQSLHSDAVGVTSRNLLTEKRQDLRLMSLTLRVLSSVFYFLITLTYLSSMVIGDYNPRFTLLFIFVLAAVGLFMGLQTLTVNRTREQVEEIALRSFSKMRDLEDRLWLDKFVEVEYVLSRMSPFGKYYILMIAEPVVWMCIVLAISTFF